MAKQIKIEFFSEGFHDILVSEGVRALVDEAATGIQERANGNLQEQSEGYKKTVMVGGFGGGRWVGFVQPIDRAAALAEAEYNALSGAV